MEKGVDGKQGDTGNYREKLKNRQNIQESPMISMKACREQGIENRELHLQLSVVDRILLVVLRPYRTPHPAFGHFSVG